MNNAGMDRTLAQAYVSYVSTSTGTSLMLPREGKLCPCFRFQSLGRRLVTAEQLLLELGQLEILDRMNRTG
jgi:hypothetical protein